MSTNTANTERFVYVTYIRTTVEKLWEALREPAFTKQYWFGVVMECEWKKGSSWKMILPDGKVADSGTIIEIDPPRKMVIHWQNQWRADLTAEGSSRATIELEPRGEMVKLTILHEMEKPVAGPSKFIAAVAGGWPQILSSLKSFLETGTPLPRDAEVKKN